MRRQAGIKEEDHLSLIERTKRVPQENSIIGGMVKSVRDMVIGERRQTIVKVEDDVI